jgi:hypothetical protein
MNYDKILRALLADVYKKQDTEIEAILSLTDEAEATNQIKGLDAARVSELSKPQKGRTFQDGYAKAKSEVLTEVENRYKDAFGIDEDLKGEDLISRIQELKAEGANPDLSKVTADDIRKLPKFQEIKREFDKLINAVKTEAETKVKELETGYKREQTFAKVSEVGIKALTELNPVLPKNATAAEKQKSSFLNEFKQYDWKEEGGEYIAIDKEGNAVVDDHGNALKASDFAKQKGAEWFDFQQNNGGENGGNGKAGEQGGTGGNAGKYPAGIAKPKTEAEMLKLTNDRSIKLEDRRAILTAWETEKAGGTQ